MQWGRSPANAGRPSPITFPMRCWMNLSLCPIICMGSFGLWKMMIWIMMIVGIVMVRIVIVVGARHAVPPQQPPQSPQPQLPQFPPPHPTQTMLPQPQLPQILSPQLPQAGSLPRNNSANLFGDRSPPSSDHTNPPLPGRSTYCTIPPVPPSGNGIITNTSSATKRP